MSKVEVQAIGRCFPGGFLALSEVNLTVEPGEFRVLLGPSGSGKTTLLRLIAGLDEPTFGRVLLNGRPASRLAPRDRDVAWVSQDPAPYPHLDVFENLAFGLRARKVPAAEIRARVQETAAALGLSDCLRRRPSTLSGGQRQRVALGRALARRPAILLLDEPLSNLDALLRAEIRADLRAMVRRLGTTTILVTHDQAEALALADRLAVLERGKLAQEGPPAEVYRRPATRFVGQFLGHPPMSFLDATLQSDAVGTLSLRLGESGTTLDADEPWTRPLRRRGAGRVELGLRPEHVALTDGATRLKVIGMVRLVEPAGHEVIATLATAGGLIRLRLSASELLPRTGDELTVHLDLTRASWFDPATGLALV